MSHRKVYSQGNIPFAWEDKPGISKATHQDCPKSFRVQALDLTTSSSSSLSSNKQQFNSHHHPISVSTTTAMKIPLPPCPALSQPPSRSSSAKGLKWQDQQDPFLLAFKECTKPVKNGKSHDQLADFDDHQYVHKKKGSRTTKPRKRMFNISFSCKSLSGCDVKNDNNFVTRNGNPQPHALPRNKLQNLMMENW